MKKLLTKTIAALLLTATVAQAQPKGRMKFLFGEKFAIQPSARYELPLEIDGSTWVEADDTGFYGRTDIAKQTGQYETVLRLEHADELHSGTYLGVRKGFDFKDFHAGVGVYPLAYELEPMAEVWASYNFQNKVSLGGFAEFTEEGYSLGELSLEKELDKMSVSVGVRVADEVQPHIGIGFDF